LDKVNFFHPHIQTRSWGATTSVQDLDTILKEVSLSVDVEIHDTISYEGNLGYYSTHNSTHVSAVQDLKHLSEDAMAHYTLTENINEGMLRISSNYKEEKHSPNSLEQRY